MHTQPYFSGKNWDFVLAMVSVFGSILVIPGAALSILRSRISPVAICPEPLA
ncbi:hypothetical protein [Providencia stuartii]|uniref:hypothetical protein n=1 Tax=Providencia stuartii TaxID=588 RepID=UPI0040689B99